MAKKKKFPREGLRKKREARGLSQARLAELIKAGGQKTVARWESGETTPQPYLRPRLAEHLGITLEELEVLLTNSQEQTLQLQTQEQQSHRRWIIPYQRNPYFTGRDELLDTLHSAFFSEDTGLIKRTLIGQPGIGKTQIAIEYAYRYGEQYQAILWATAETRNTFISDAMRVASILHLPEKDDPDKQRVIDGVKQWLNGNTGWLLILDNVEDPNLLDDFLPHEGHGHVLLTARDPEVGTRATTVTIGKMAKEDGALLLLRRSKLIQEQGKLNQASEQEQENALEISEKMAGHPLALDQAGAYIAETGCTIAKYLEIYSERRTNLLDDRGRKNLGHPSSLTATILLSLEKIEQVNPVAANLLRMCAFLHPDDIPEELFTTGDNALEPRYHPVAANAYILMEALRELVKYSFIQYQTKLKTISIHRLVQTVLMDQMNDETQFYWADHAVWVLTRIPSYLEFEDWKQYQRYISHALVCIELIDTWKNRKLFHEDTIYFAALVGTYLRKSGLYTQAEAVCLHALDLAKEILEPSHDVIIIGYNNLAQLYERQGDYEKAESFYLNAVALCAIKPSSTTYTSATTFYNLAYFVTTQPPGKKALKRLLVAAAPARVQA